MRGPMDERGQLLTDFQEKRERLNQQAHRHREVRDRMNDQTKAHAQRRDGFNAQVRALVDQANQHKAKRDVLNAQVKAGKVRRDELNKEAQAKSEALAALRKDRGPPPVGQVPIGKLRAEVRHLEYQQQTTVLTPQKEKALIELIASKLKELKEREGAFVENDQAREAYEAMRAAKQAAEEQHQAVTVLANQAQVEHDAMVQFFNQADALRKEADAAQADFVRSKIDADKVHREYIDAVSAIRDLEKVMTGLRAGATRQERDAMPGGQTNAEVQAEAESIFDKFRKGEKLSTEDLMALQKAGRL